MNMRCKTRKIYVYYSVPDNDYCNDCWHLKYRWVLVKKGREYACDTFRDAYDCKIFKSEDLKCEGEKIKKCKQCLNSVHNIKEGRRE